MWSAHVRKQMNEEVSTRNIDTDAAGVEWLENGYSALFTTQELRTPGKRMAGRFISGCCKTRSLNGLNKELVKLMEDQNHYNSRSAYSACTEEN